MKTRHKSQQLRRLVLVPLFAILYWAYVLVLIVLFFAASPFVFISHAFGKDKEGWENYTANFWPSIFAELSTDIPQIAPWFAEIIPPCHRRGNEIIFAAA